MDFALFTLEIKGFFSETTAMKPELLEYTSYCTSTYRVFQLFTNLFLAICTALEPEFFFIVAPIFLSTLSFNFLSSFKVFIFTDDFLNWNVIPSNNCRNLKIRFPFFPQFYNNFSSFSWNFSSHFLSDYYTACDEY